MSEKLSRRNSMSVPSFSRAAVRKQYNPIGTEMGEVMGWGNF